MSPCPKISVIIPVYNVQDYLCECLQSVARQTLQDIEVIAIDDGSTDGSACLLAQAQQHFTQLHIVTQPNQGVAAARRAGLARATGETVCFVDADDVLDAHYLEELWRVYNQTNAPLVLAPLVRFTKSVPDTFHVAPFFEAGCLHGVQRVRVFEDFSAAMALCGKLIRRSQLAGVTFPDSRTGDDILPAVTLLSVSNPVALAPRAVYFYRERAGSQSRAGDGRFEGILNGFVQARRVLKKHGTYQAFAPGFEYVCRVCITSFMEKYGLTPAEQEKLSAVREEMHVPASIFRGRAWRFRVRQRVFDFCLRAGLPYRGWRFLRQRGRSFKK